MEKVAFIVDGGFFVKKYKEKNKKYPTADDVEKYIQKIFDYIKKNSTDKVEIYRVFYYDCPPLNNLSKSEIRKNKPTNITNENIKNICSSFTKNYKTIKKFHDSMKRKDFFALRMGQLKIQGWWPNQTNPNYAKLKIRQKGVDMRIGLDIASITAKKLCTKLVLISGDIDMIPAMKTARKEGVHVYWHSIDDGRHGSNLELATHSDIVLTKKRLKI